MRVFIKKLWYIQCNIKVDILSTKLLSYHLSPLPLNDFVSQESWLAPTGRGI